MYTTLCMNYRTIYTCINDCTQLLIYTRVWDASLWTNDQKRVFFQAVGVAHRDIPHRMHGLNYQGKFDCDMLLCVHVHMCIRIIGISYPNCVISGRSISCGVV